MCPVEKIASCQISFIPIASDDYLAEINKVLNIIMNSGLDYEIGILSTVVKGKKSLVLKLILDLYETMDNLRDFTMDIKLSNLCGCDA